jgi:hypothetical protein
MKTQILASGAAGLFALAVSGCGSGHSAAPSSPPPPPPPPAFDMAKTDTLVLNADEINAVTGLKLNYQDKAAPGWTQPSKPSVLDQGDPACLPLWGFSTASVGTVYTAYRQNTSREDKDTFDHSVSQTIVVVADAGAAKQLLSDAVAKPLSACDGKIIHIKDQKTLVQIHKTLVSDIDVKYQTALMTMDEPQQPTGWACVDDVQVKSNVVVDATVCQNGNGAPLAKTVADKISGKVSGTNPT